MKKKLFIAIAILLSMQIFALAGESPSQKTPDLAALGKSWEESRDKYRDALKEKKESLQQLMREKEMRLENEGAVETRKTLIGDLHSLQSERDDLNDKIREINVSDVVKFSTGRDKFFSALTGQTTT